MRNTTPFFAEFHRLLFGRAQRSAQEQLLAQNRAFEQATLCQLGRACAPWVPTRLLAPRERGHHSRRRLFPQSLTFWAFLSQIGRLPHLMVLILDPPDPTAGNSALARPRFATWNYLAEFLRELGGLRAVLEA